MVVRMRKLFLAVALSLACGKGAPDRTFPKTFLFGAAIAGFQVDMGCPTVARAQCEDARSDWYDWITRPELQQDPNTHLSGQPPTAGPGFYELYDADIARAARELHSNALRLSIEWSRIFPQPTYGVSDLRAAASPAALAYYHAVFASMKAHGLVPLVTLDHYTLPSWLHDAAGCHANLDACTRRGWLDPRTVEEAERYAGFVAREFGGEVDLWATMNEPFTAVILAGYIFPSDARTNPPGVSLRWKEAKRVFAAMIEANARMADAVRSNDLVDATGGGFKARVGIVYNLQAVTPKNPASARDVQAARDLGYLMNQMFLDGAFNGDLDLDWNGHPVHRAELAGRMDFLGINYYVRVVAEGLGGSLYPSESPLLTFNPFTLEQHWDDATGLGEVLDFARRYGKPLFITETGYQDPDDNGSGARWIESTVREVRAAMGRGGDVQGYFYWTLMDNYEWNHGMTFRMGLYAVDPKDVTKARRARPAAVAAFARAATERTALPASTAPAPASR